MENTESLTDAGALHKAGADSTDIPIEREASVVDVRDDHWRHDRALQPGIAHIFRVFPAEALESGTVEENIEPPINPKPQSPGADS